MSKKYSFVDEEFSQEELDIIVNVMVGSSIVKLDSAKHAISDYKYILSKEEDSAEALEVPNSINENLSLLVKKVSERKAKDIDALIQTGDIDKILKEFTQKIKKVDKIVSDVAKLVEIAANSQIDHKFINNSLLQCEIGIEFQIEALEKFKDYVNEFIANKEEEYSLQ